MEKEFMSLYWERSEFQCFGPLPQCCCSYNVEEFITRESGTILLPPSPNWFLNDAVDSRSEDGLLVTAAFKTIVVYHCSSEERLPKILKIIPSQNEKVLVVRLHPSTSDVDYGHSVASIGDEGSVRLHDMHTGTLVSEHTQHKGTGVSCLCWGSVGGEEVLASVGNGGKMVIWQPKYGATRVFTLSLKNFNNLSLVESDPKDRSRALVVAEKSIALVSFKDGRILMNLHGHDYGIYSLRWYTGEGNPFSQDVRITNSRAEAMMEDKKVQIQQPEEEKKESNLENWRSDSSATDSCGPYFASSDYGRNVFVWDLTSKKYVTRFNVPLSVSGFKKPQGGKDRGPGKQHIPLVWYNGALLTSTVRGELLQWTISVGHANYKALQHLHTRAIYTLHVVGNNVISTGQDRLIQGYSIPSAAHIFTLPTLGGCATALAFCPHDANRLAIGTQESNIRILNFGSEIPLQALSVFQNIKGKVMSLMWHPEHETRLLFGTGSGQVGWTDVANGRTNVFAYYHQKAVYKVEWGPPICPEKTGIKDNWCVYSFGDKELVIRSPHEHMADPVRLHTLVPESKGTSFPKDVTEFSFSPDFKFIAVGTMDGQVVIVQCSSMVILVKLTVVRKSIQHLLWQPPAQNTPSYTLAVASNENKIYIFYLDSMLNGGDVGLVVTQAGGELCGHEARVVWLAWSPHTPSILASASYDHTIQIWDTTKGEPLINYGGHTSRVFRVEFSPCDPDLMYSQAEENTVHTWRPSQQKTKTPGESNSVLKDFKKEQGMETCEESATPQEAKDKKAATNNSDAGVVANGIGSTGVGGSTDVSFRKVTQKSFFPKLHKVTSRKKSFHHLLILNMLAAQVNDDRKGEKELEDELEDDLEEGNEVEGTSEEENGDDILQTISQTSEKYRCLLEKDGEMADPSEFNYALSMYGNLEQVDSVVAAEIQLHESKGNQSQVSIMQCWRGTLDQQIQWAARHHKLTPFLVAAAPQVSHKLWVMASEAYAEQLVEEGDVITGATYLVNINKVTEAVDMLTRQKHFREAYTVARCRLGYDDELRAKVVGKWVSCAIYEGNYDLAATLQLSQGEIEGAARTLSRRIDPGSLFVAAQLYQAAGQNKLAEAMGISALREASVKQDMTRIEPFLSHMPELNWYQAIFCCHRVLLSVVQQVNKKQIYSYLLRSDQNLDEVDYEEDNSKEKGDKSTEKKECLKVEKDNRSDSNLKENKRDSHVKDNQECTSNGKTNITSVIGVEADSSTDSQEKDHEIEVKWMTVVERVRQEWEAKGITQDKYRDIYQAIIKNFSTQLMPSSLKQVWFLVAVAITESLLAETTEAHSQHLNVALQYTLSWGKADQLFHLTHLLLSKGPQNLSTLESASMNHEDLGTSPSIKNLRHLYHFSELAVIHSFIQNDKLLPILQDCTSQKSETSHSVSTVQEIDSSSQKIHENLALSGSVEKMDSNIDDIKDNITAKMENLALSGNAKLDLCTVELAKESLDEVLKEDKNETIDSSVPGITFQLPHSVPELLATLNSCLNHLNQEPELKMDLGSGFSKPNQLILDIADHLRGNGCSEKIVQILTATAQLNT